jgi:RimJ/RimL family protein N-acetyltransferase
LICLFDPQNVASRRVAERVGFTFDRDVFLDGDRIPMHSLRAGSTRRQ